MPFCMAVFCLFLQANYGWIVPITDVRPLRLDGDKKICRKRKKGALSEALTKAKIRVPNFLAA